MKALVISVGSHEYLLDTEPILRITRSDTLLSIEDTPRFIKGVAKFRDYAIPVIDLHERLHVPESDEPGLHSCFIILESPKGILGLYADYAKNLIELDRPLEPSKVDPKRKEKGSRGVERVELDGNSYAFFTLENLLDDAEWKEFDELVVYLKENIPSPTSNSEH